MANLISILLSVALLLSFSLASTIMRYDKAANHEKKSCGWELMQDLGIVSSPFSPFTLSDLQILLYKPTTLSNIYIEIPISHIGNWYAAQTGDRSLCTRQDDGSEYCTCIYECGNGIWVSVQGKHEEDEVKEWTWTEGCEKYCHIGVCDGQD